jgi:dCTP deaminase
MILPAQAIQQRNIIHPFRERFETNGLTGGLSPAGYDISIAQSLTLTHNMAFRLASSQERFTMPADILGQVCDKSTWARRGLFVQNTVIEPGWTGWLTLELTFHGKGALHISQGEPIAQVIFMQLVEPTEMPYQGAYQNQRRGAVAGKEDV